MISFDAFAEYRYPNDIGAGVYDIHSPRGPETVIQRIARHRATGKSNPEFYARHTVEKALAELATPPTRPRLNSSAEAESNREPGH